MKNTCANYLCDTLNVPHLECDCHKEHKCIFVYGPQDQDRHEAEYIVRKLPHTLKIYHNATGLNFVFLDPVTYSVVFKRAIKGKSAKYLDKHTLFNVVIPLTEHPLEMYDDLLKQLQTYLTLVPEATDSELQEFIRSQKEMDKE